MARKSPGTITKRKNGLYQVGVSLGDGQRRYFYTRDDKEAQRILREKLNLLDEGRLRAQPSDTLEGYLNQWLHVVEGSVRQRTNASYQLCVKRIVAAPIRSKDKIKTLGSVKLEGLQTAMVQDAYLSLLNGGIVKSDAEIEWEARERERMNVAGLPLPAVPKMRPLSPRSVEQTHAVLHTALEEAVRQGHLKLNPCKYARVPRPPKTEMQTLSQEELMHLFETSSVCDDVRGEWHETKWAALWVLLGTAGVRLGEALGLTWKDVNLDKGTVSINRALQRDRGGKGLIFVEPKSWTSRRTIELTTSAIAALREHRLKQKRWRLQVGGLWQDQGLVFTSDVGGPVEPSYINRALNKALEKAGLRHIRVHDLRHTCASIHMAIETPALVVQQMLGHSNISLTLGTYSHIQPRMLRAAADRMEGSAPRGRWITRKASSPPRTKTHP